MDTSNLELIGLLFLGAVIFVGLLERGYRKRMREADEEAIRRACRSNHAPVYGRDVLDVHGIDDYDDWK